MLHAIKAPSKVYTERVAVILTINVVSFTRTERFSLKTAVSRLFMLYYERGQQLMELGLHRDINPVMDLAENDIVSRVELSQF